MHWQSWSNQFVKHMIIGSLPWLCIPCLCLAIIFDSALLVHTNDLVRSPGHVDCNVKVLFVTLYGRASGHANAMCKSKCAMTCYVWGDVVALDMCACNKTSNLFSLKWCSPGKDPVINDMCMTSQCQWWTPPHHPSAPCQHQGGWKIVVEWIE